MKCSACKKRWFCFTACPAINAELCLTHERLGSPPRTSWFRGAVR